MQLDVDVFRECRENLPHQQIKFASCSQEGIVRNVFLAFYSDEEEKRDKMGACRNGVEGF